MEPERRNCRCNRCGSPDEIRAEIRRKHRELAWGIVEVILALALAATIGALLLWGTAKHAEHYEDRTQPRGLNDDGSSD